MSVLSAIADVVREGGEVEFYNRGYVPGVAVTRQHEGIRSTSRKAFRTTDEHEVARTIRQAWKEVQRAAN